MEEVGVELQAKPALEYKAFGNRSRDNDIEGSTLVALQEEEC